MTRNILIFQITYYSLTALWPIFHMRSFEAVSGPKKEHWLVYTVSVLLLGIVSPMIYHVIFSEALSMEIKILSVMCAIALALIDFIFSLRGVIWKTYLVDGVIQILIVTGYLCSGN